MHLHLDPVGGCAGDMFLAALLDAWPEHTDDLLAALRTLPLPASVTVRVVAHRDHAFTGTRFIAEDRSAEPAPGADGHDHGHHHGHHHTRFSAIRRQIGEAPLDDGVRRRALDIFTHLAEAEGQVHGIPVDRVAFHEVGAWDSILDIVGAAWMIEALGAATWSVAPLPVGSGRVESAHGTLPIPAPATLLLLAGRTLWDDGVAGERVTPTGAAVLRHLAPRDGLGPAPRRLLRSGMGFGGRRLGDLSNVLRVLAFEEVSAADAAGEDEVAVVEFEVDDQSPEDLAIGLDHLRSRDGVLDVVQSAVFGKKGRLATAVRALVRPAHLEPLIEGCFHETTTLGVRWQRVRRVVLERHTERWRDGDGRVVEVKRSARPHAAPTAKAAIDDVADAGGAAERARLRRRAEEAVLDAR